MRSSGQVVKYEAITTRAFLVEWANWSFKLYRACSVRSSSCQSRSIRRRGTPISNISPVASVVDCYQLL
jgi:hypothetical protein